jgi:hypothetical protein
MEDSRQFDLFMLPVILPRWDEFSEPEEHPVAHVEVFRDERNLSGDPHATNFIEI